MFHSSITPNSNIVRPILNNKNKAVQIFNLRLLINDNPCILFNKHHLHALSKVL